MSTMAGQAGGLSHMALFYRDQDEYLAQVPAFARAALASAEPVLVAVPGPSARRLREQIGGEPGQVGYADMTELGRNPARIIPALQAFVDRHRGQRVRFVGEPAWPGRSAAELREATRHEALINLAFSGTPATILCPYDAADLAPSVIAAARRTHPALIENGRLHAAAAYAGQGNLPPDCHRPLPPPPAHAEVLGYHNDLRPVRRLVQRQALSAGLPDERAADLMLAASEVAANTLRHTPADGTLHIWRTSQEILCQVHDQGHITDPLVGRRRQPDGPGHGLWLVNQICDLVELRSSQAGTTIRLHMRLRIGPDSPRSPPNLAAAAGPRGAVRSRNLDTTDDQETSAHPGRPPGTTTSAG